MAQADQKCKEEIMKAKREMEERMLKAQRVSHDIPLQVRHLLSCVIIIEVIVTKEPVRGFCG